MSVPESSNNAETSAGATTRAVVEAVSAATGASAADLPPLYEAVDPDALNALFSVPGANGEVTFRYAGCVVTVRADGTVDVADA